MKLKATDIGQMASASEVIFEALREAIAQGDVKEGEALRQDHIARMFNVSRIPVREALTRLEEQGLVATQRYKGAVVASLSIDEIREIFEFRALLEPEILRYSVKRMTSDALGQAKRFADTFSTETDSSRWGDLNRSFHYALYEEANRPYYLQTISTALDRVDRYLRAQLVLTSGMERARREHQGILEACIARDAALAARLTREHILGACESLIDFLTHQRAGEAEKNAR